MSQCTYRCVVLPDTFRSKFRKRAKSQCTYRCVVLPDYHVGTDHYYASPSQCTCRCVVLPDSPNFGNGETGGDGLNAPAGAWCSLTHARVVPGDPRQVVSMHLQVRGAP